MNINSLCDDLLIDIFSYLPLKTKINSELVCKRWRSVLLTYCQPKSLRFELLIYKRSNYRLICKKKDHEFTDFNTIKFKEVDDINKIEKVLWKFRDRLEALCFGFSFFNHFQYLIQNTNCLPVMVKNLKNLEHFQCKSFGDGITTELFENCKFLIMKLKHFSFDYKEEDFTKISIQPWIEVLLKYGTNLESIYIKFQRMGIKFPFNLPLPPNLKFLYLPSCDLTKEEFHNLLKNGGKKLVELSVHSISSGFLLKLKEEAPLLKKLNTRIRVDPDPSLHIENLKSFNKMDLITLNQFISPAIANNQTFTLNYGIWTIIDIISNCPETKHLRLKSIPFIKRYNTDYRSEGDEERAEDMFSDEEEEINEHDLNNNFEFNNQIEMFNRNVLDLPIFNQTNSFEFNYINSQFKLLEIKKSNWNFVEQITIKLNEKKIDCYYNEAINRLIICLSEFQNLKIVQIEKVQERNLNTFNILKLVDSCKKLTNLHIGEGRRITPEIVDLFVERAMQNPNKNYELKFKNQPPTYNIVLPFNLNLI